MIGRFSQYSGNFTFDLDGSVLPAGTPTVRKFATEEYDVYGQDIWKPYRNLTLTLGLRYGLSRPVYETKGFQVVPDQRLGDVFNRRVAGAAAGARIMKLSISSWADRLITLRVFTEWIGTIFSRV